MSLAPAPGPRRSEALRSLPLAAHPPPQPTSGEALDAPTPASIERRIFAKVGQAIGEHRLIEDGDHLMVCVSGGKDSYALLDVLLDLARRAPVRFELTAVNVDQGWPGYDTATIARHLTARGVRHRMVAAHEIAGVVERVLRPAETGATPCSLCSRLRRGVLYGLAEELGATKIALGHHLDDAAETLLLNLFFSGQLSAMPGRYATKDGRHTVIRPLVYVEERDLIAYAAAHAYPVVRCSCPTCGLPEQQRQVMKRMLAGFEAEHPGTKTRMLAAMRNVRPGHLLDRALVAALAGAGDERVATP